MTRDEEMRQIRKLIGIWLNEIELANAQTYYDINKVSEHLCRQLLNLVYGYELLDLNDENNPNFPGLDIGDKTLSKIAFQVTSRVDRQKVIENLKTVIEKDFDKVFTAGIKFMILKMNSTISFTKKKDPTAILKSFDSSRDIIYPKDLILSIEDIYEKEGDLIKFNKIKGLLEKELYPKFPDHVIEKQSKDLQALQASVSGLLEKSSAITTGFETSGSYLQDELQVPVIKNFISRENLVDKYIELLKQQRILWVKGPFSTGKTSMAILASQKIGNLAIWLDFRGDKEDQVVDHFLNSLGLYLKIERKLGFKEMVGDLIAQLKEETLIIINDLPLLSPILNFKERISYILGELQAAGHLVIVTSNFTAPDSFSDTDDLDMAIETIEPFTNEETSLLLQSYGAQVEIADALKQQVTIATAGHPLLIRSAAKFLRDRKWKIESEELLAIFTGKFDPSTDKSTYAKLLQETSDQKTVELLYRLKYAIGSFNRALIDAVAKVEPEIDRVGERLNELDELWIQENGKGSYQISPLIKHLDDNVGNQVKKDVYSSMARTLLSEKPISPVKASAAILYYSFAQDYNNAGLVLVNLLHAFSKASDSFFDWGLDMHWFRSPLPQEMMPHFKVQIRVGQLLLAKAKDMDMEFLRGDLISIVSEQGTGLIDRYLANTALFQIDFRKHPLMAMDELSAVEADGRALAEDKNFAKLIKEDRQVLLDDHIMNGIWLIFSQLTTLDEFNSWFDRLPENIPESALDAMNNETYALAGASIYRNLVARQLDSPNIPAELNILMHRALEKEFYLIAAYSLKYLIKYTVDVQDDLNGAILLVDSHQQWLDNSSISNYLVRAELGALCLGKGKREEAFVFLDPLRDIRLPDFYIEQIDYLIAAMQLYFSGDGNLSASLSSRALDMAKKSPSIINEDRFKLYGEAAIGLAHTRRSREALYLLAEGFEKVLDNYLDTDEFKAIVIRFGHTIMYVIQRLASERPRDFGDKEKFVIPEPGFFYRNSQTLLESGFYFEERKFMVATIATDGFEEILDYEMAKRWAYRALELITSLLEEPRFLAIIQKFVFYPVDDKRYLQAYNILAEVQMFYTRIAEKVDQGQANAEMQALVERARASKSLDHDIGVYLYILFPVALDFSLRILNGEMKIDDFQANIDAAFNNGKYVLVDPEEFAYAKWLFEQIMINGMDYGAFMAEHGNKNSENKDFIYAISCFLISTFASPTEAANIQLANLVTLDATFKNTITAFYNFQIIPYFEKFWKQKFENDTKSFSFSDNLRDKGFPLIEKTNPFKRVTKIFHVLTHHLKLTITPQIEKFIEQED